MRKITSIVLALTFMLVSITGVQIVVGGHGPENVQYTVEQSQPDIRDAESHLKPFYPYVAHEWGGYIFIIAGLIHFWFNLKPMKSYLGISLKSKKNE